MPTLDRDFVTNLRLDNGKKDQIWFDDDLRGFGVRMRAAGKKSASPKALARWVLFATTRAMMFCSIMAERSKRHPGTCFGPPMCMRDRCPRTSRAMLV